VAIRYKTSGAIVDTEDAFALVSPCAADRVKIKMLTALEFFAAAVWSVRVCCPRSKPREAQPKDPGEAHSAATLRSFLLLSIATSF